MFDFDLQDNSVLGKWTGQVERAKSLGLTENEIP